VFWIVGILVILVGAGAVAGYGLYARAEAIRSDMQSAQAEVPALAASAAALDFDAASASLEKAATYTTRAVELTNDPLWRAVEALPIVGTNVAAVNEIASITDQTLEAAKPLLAAGPMLLPGNFAPIDGAIPIQPLLDAQPIVHAAAARLADLEARTRGLNVDGTIDAITAAKASLIEQLGKINHMLGSADSALTVAPSMLGSDSPKTYVVMFLNNAELRSLGGTALSFVELRVDRGRIELVQAIPAGFNHFPALVDSIVPVPDGFETIAPNFFGRFITNAGVRPSMRSAADVVTANWERQFGRTPDAVISMDVVALSYILAATGPVDTGEWVVDSTNAVDILLNQVLNAFDSGNFTADNARQDQVYASLVDQTFARVSGGAFDASKMIEAIGRAAGERRLMVAAEDPDLQQVLADAGVQEGVPERAGDADVAGVYLNDTVGSKLNFYLDTDVDVTAACTDPGKRRMTVVLTSTVTPDQASALNPAVLGGYASQKLDPGVQRLLVLLYAPIGAQISSVTLDGTDVEVAPTVDAGHSVQPLQVLVPPGAASTITVEFSGVDPSQSLSADVTPSVRAATVATDTVCG